MGRVRMVVSLDAPEGCSRDDIGWYIEEAVATWKGGQNPDSPIFGLDPDSVVVYDPWTKETY